MSKNKDRHEKSGRKDDDDHHSGHMGRDKIHVLVGTNGNNILNGTGGKDFILGKKGDDQIDGGAGNDFLFGGKGNDFLDGGAGNDRLFGGRGDDVALYSMAANLGAGFTDIGTRDYYDGGKGFDTLQLALTSGERLLASVQQDIAAFQTFLAQNANLCGDKEPVFHFSSFDLTARDFEALAFQLVNSAPTARADAASTDENTLLVIAAPSVLANDTDPDHLDVLAVTGADAKSMFGATVMVRTDGSLSYDPTAALALQQLAQGATATDSFSYTIADLAGATSAAAVKIVVTGVNDAPVAGDDKISTSEDTLLNGAVLASDVDTGGTFGVSAVNGQSSNVGTVITLASGARLTVNADSSYSYDPNGKFEYLAVGKNAADSFTYVVTDNHGATSDTATVALTITGVNDAPKALGELIDGTGGSVGPIRVAVVGGTQTIIGDAAAQLNDENSTAFDLDATAILFTKPTTFIEWRDAFAGYDVVVIGDDGDQIFDYLGSQIFAALRGFVDTGGGVVTTGAFAKTLFAYDGDADHISPTAPFPGGEFLNVVSGSTINIADPLHPIAGGITDYLAQGYHEVAGAVDNTLLATATVLATDSSARAAIAYDEVGAGRTVYLGSVHMAADSPFLANLTRTADSPVDQIFERAVAWAAGDRSGSGAATNEDTVLVIDSARLLENDTDVDTGDVLSIEPFSTVSKYGATVSLDGGNVVYDPTVALALQALNAGQIVTDSFDYTVIDGHGGSAIATVSLTVAGITDTLI